MFSFKKTVADGGCMGSEAGSAVLLMMTLLVMVGAGLFLEGRSLLRASFPIWLEDAKMLGVAREGLQAYFAVSGGQGGVLPCPDGQLSGTGRADLACRAAVGGVAVGWLPWQTLGLMPLQTAAGDGVWYAVSTAFVQPMAAGGRPLLADWGGIKQGGGLWAAVLFVPRLPPRPGEPVVLSTLLQEAQVVPVLVEELGDSNGLAR